MDSLRAVIGLTDDTSAGESSAGSSGAVANPAFLLSSSLPPISPKLVAKFQSLHYVDMKEFLLDNVLLGKRLDVLGACVKTIVSRVLEKACGDE